MTLHTRIDSPIGELLVVRDEVGITHLYLPNGKHPTTDPEGSIRDDEAFADVRTQLDEYFTGNRTTFDLPLHATASAFQRKVWDALVAIPHGETASYGELAGRIGSAGAARAVGLANGQNPISIIVPCHRVIGANGSLTGYAGGIEAKKWLLAHEAAHARVGLFG